MSDFGDFGNCNECGEYGTHGDDCSWGKEENNISGYRGRTPNLFSITFGIVIFIIVGALLLGIAVTGPVIKFLLYVLLFAGLLTILLK